jgi:putative component of membrane protein insertase Oxa1/YidC/SpoIIIJ protein YidD
VIAGVFGSTFVKTALQLGNAAQYASLDTFPWCPLLRCYWGWRDMCHNCELCYNSGGGGEACNNNGYHTAGGLLGAMRVTSAERAPFRSFIASVERDFRCRPFAEHPLAPTMYERPVVGSIFAAPLPRVAATADTACAVRSSAAADKCVCGFRRFRGVDNALLGEKKPNYGYGAAVVPLSTLRNGRPAAARDAPSTLADCERSCCDEPLCHSVVWRANTSTCIAALAINHGAREGDWCWHPTRSANALTSIRLPGAWEATALQTAQRYLRANTLVRRGTEPGPRAFAKYFHSPVGHSHPMERHMRATSCDAAAGGALEVSEIGAGAVPLSNELDGCRAPPHVNRARWKVRGP